MSVSPVGAAPPAVASTQPRRPGFAALLDQRVAAARPGPLHPATRNVVAALAHVERAQARLDAVLAAARAGRTFTAAELLGLQAEAYRCAQTVDLASKLVEQGAQSVKQALNTPV